MDPGLEYKQKGSDLFKAGKFREAAEAYAKAIEIKSPQIPIYYTNRAICFAKLKEWSLVTSLCQKAIELDKTNVKAYFFLGSALTETSETCRDAVENLKKAYELSIRQNMLNFSKQILEALTVARRRKWDLAERSRLKSCNDFKTNLNELILNEKTRMLSLTDGDEDAKERLDQGYEDKINQLDHLYEDFLNKKMPQVPDCYLDKITLNVMQDPVITPSGITYERTSILTHLKIFGNFDPITREPVTESTLVPNIALRDAIEAFLFENGWAVDW